MSKRTNTVDNLILLCFFLILLFLALIGNSLWLLLFLIGAMAFVIKVIIEGIFAVKVKYPFITYYPLAVLLFFGYGALCVTFEDPLQAIILVIAIFLSTVSLVVVKPNINMLKSNFNALLGLSYKKQIPPIGFGAISALAGATIFLMITMVTVNISWLYSVIPGVLGGIGVRLGAKISDFKPTKALKFLGIAMGIISVLIGYYFVYKWIDISTFKTIGLKGLFSFKEFFGTYSSLDTFLAFFFGGLFGGYMGIDFSAGVLYANEKMKSILTKAKATVLLLVCMGIFLILIALGGFDDYIKLGHVLLYDLTFIIGIFSFSCGIHKLKLELLDILIITTSSVAIAILLFDCFLDYQPQNTLFYAMLSVEGLSTLLIIAIIFGMALFILDFVGIHFFMDLFPHLKVTAILSVFVIRPTVLWIISLFVSGFSVNFFGAVVGVLVITSLVPRWDQFLSKIEVISHGSPEGEEITRGDALAHVGRHEEAIKCFDKALEVNPKHEGVWNNKGLALVNLGRFEEAIKYFDKAIELNPRLEEACNNKGLALMDLDRYEEAINYFDKAIEINPRYENAWNNKGVALARLGRHGEAINNYDRALKINLGFENAWDNKGLALLNLGRFEEAVICFDNALEINPRYEDAWNNKGVALGSLGRFEEALTCFDRVFEINPRDEGAKMNRERVLNMQKTYYSAEKSVSEIYSNEKYGFSLKYPKGWILYIGGPKPEFLVGLNVLFGIPRKVACSIIAGPIGQTIYGRTLKELENRARILRQNLNAGLLSSKRLTLSGIDAYEHVCTVKFPTRYVKHVSFFKEDNEYLLTFTVFSQEDFLKYEPIFDECLQSFKFKRGGEVESGRDPAYR